ncbi:MAG: UDP-N-acetylmuramate dehydrogenase [bacterium]
MTQPPLEEWLEARWLNHPDVEIHRAEALARHTSMGIGGPAPALLVLHTWEALEVVLRAAHGAEISLMPLGGGSNTVFSDAPLDRYVFKLGRDFQSFQIMFGARIEVGAAATLTQLLKAAAKLGLSGLEFTYGIPGTLGGALAGNAGAQGTGICELVDNVEVYTFSGRRKFFTQGEFEFHYRQSELKQYVITKAMLQLKPSSRAEVADRLETYKSKRWTQPLGVKCSGCVFKNPPGDHAGRLIDAAGLKGARVGGVEVSAVHANFFINNSHGTMGDLAHLIELVRGKVKEKFGVELELEIQIF